MSPRVRALANQRGQALTESLLTIPFVGMVLVLGIGALYLGFAQLWMNRAAREAAVCLSTPSPPTRCRSRLENTLASTLVFGRTEIVEFRSDIRGSRVAVHLKFSNRTASSNGQLIRAAASYRKPIFFPRGDS